MVEDSFISPEIARVASSVQSAVPTSQLVDAIDEEAREAGIFPVSAELTATAPLASSPVTSGGAVFTPATSSLSQQHQQPVQLTSGDTPVASSPVTSGGGVSTAGTSSQVQLSSTDKAGFSHLYAASQLSQASTSQPQNVIAYDDFKSYIEQTMRNVTKEPVPGVEVR